MIVPENKQMRTPGYFWVRRSGGRWEVAYYGTSWDIYGWWACGEEYPFYDEDKNSPIAQIGERISPPAEEDGK
jgi:hypothetical protein